MVFLGIYSLLSAIETLSLFFYYLSIKSNIGENVILGFSLQRLFFLIFLIIFAFVFILFFYYSLKKPDKVRLHLKPIFGNEKSSWALSTFLILSITFLFWLLSKQNSFFGDFHLILIRMEPFFVLMIILLVQAAMIIGIRYIFIFIVGGNYKEHNRFNKQIIHLFGLFFIIVLIKLFFVTATSYGPDGTGDEMTYFDMAESIYRGFFSPMQTNHYPPLYPILLTLAFPFKGWTFEAIKLINVILSTSILFPLYFISRQFISHEKSIYIVSITSLIPFHLVFPRQILSENLFYPIFLWVMLFTFSYPKNERFHLNWDVLNGFFIGLMYLTRYITLVTIPFLFVAWGLKNIKIDHKLTFPSDKLINLLFLTLFTVLTFFPWVAYGLKDGVPLKIILGFGIASYTTPYQLTFINFITWIVLYLAYFLLIASPVLPFLSKIIWTFDWRNWNKGFNRWVMQIFLLMIGFLIAVSRHSWRAYYNKDIPSGIMGRYLIVFSSIFIITALISNEKNTALKRPTLKSLLKYIIIPLTLVVISFLIIVEGKILPTDGSLMKYNGSADGFLIKLISPVYLIFISILYLIIYNHLLFKNNKMYIAFYIVLILYYSSGLFEYNKTMLSYQTYPWLSKQISELIPKPDPITGEYSEISVFLPKSRTSKNEAEIYNGLRIRGIDKTKIALDSIENIQLMETSQGFIIKELNGNDLYKYPSLKKYYFNDHYYLIEKILY